ncbi:hypothetical protein HPB49_026126 [Dermacentor silvarum]|uniref:ELMO domain-containing protein 1 n=1 Tax=Dermacentor silvarum TaxID=543639 RepID=UPI00189B5F69|nr:ELMO domain-containing protein 1 [Dermacentor silvarum]XP_049515636.1 ELMO domain-containing protein 1 [Dermacentor silvarum]KAH7987028.1 hypothetical protein HPB49_026126 [Dermacentor silvarum]
MWALLSRIAAFLYMQIRPTVKWILRSLTRLCELQRICYGTERGCKRTRELEWSLQMSRTPAVRTIYDRLMQLADEGRFTKELCATAVEYAVIGVTCVKKINTQVHREFVRSFRTSMLQMCGYRQLVYEVELLRKTQFVAQDPEHLNKLLRLWKLLRPDEHLRGPVSKQWTEVGFQGEDPRTDFRGMGMLGLENLVFFATEYTEVARHVLSHSLHPQFGYSFAIVGINLTSLLYHLLVKGKLKSHVYNAVAERPHVDDFHRVYCYVFFEFDKFWLAEKPADIMEFNRIRDKFEDRLVQMLEKDDCVFKLTLAVKKV